MDFKVIQKKKQERAKLIKQARDLLERAEENNRNLTAEEREQYDKIMEDANDLSETIQRMEQQWELERGLENTSTEPIKPQLGDGGEGRGKENKEEYRAALNKFLRGGMSVLGPEEQRVLQVSVDSSGGYIAAPQQFVAQLLKEVDDAVFIRQLATTFQLEKSVSLGVPSLDSDLNDADWTTELATGTQDDNLKFGKRELKPNPIAKRVKVSKKLIDVSAISIDDLIRQRMNYKFAVTFEKAYLTGDGVDKPLGLFVASNDGISTNRDVSDGNTTTGVEFDGLINAKYKLKGQYWPRANWLFHRDVVKEVAKLKDNNGQYLWRESVRVGEPDRILGFPVRMSEFAPNTMTAGKYVGLLGDFSYYWIADAMDMTIQRLVELYAESNQIGYIGRMESDGMPVLEEAFVRVKLATS